MARATYLLLLLLISSSTFAQKNVTKQRLLWARYDLQFNMDKWKLQQEVEHRTYIAPWRKHQLLVRTSLHRSFNEHISGNVGFTYFEQSFPQDPDTSLYFFLQELRPHFTLSTKNEIAENLIFDHRLMNELRFFETEKNQFPYGNFRVRYQAQLTKVFNEHWNAKLFNEVMFNIAKNVIFNSFDQNRLGVVLQHKINAQWSYDLSYFKWYQQLPTGVDYVSRDIFRLSVHHKLN